ncbi:MAG: alkaline phosphatase, partial [Treponema sp.]|nr:alkaline phosphatase [Treponema sp.]
IDWAAHGNEPVALISEILAFDQAVGAALDFARNCGRTIIIIASDHGTGGVTMGDRATDHTYHSDPVSRFIAPLAQARGSFESVFFMALGGQTDVQAMMYSVFGIDNLSAGEIQAIAAVLGNFIALRDTIGAIVSSRANIGWTTGGHVGSDPTFYSFLPGNRRLVGLFSLTDLARIVESSWDVNLEELSSMIFNDALYIFRARGADVAIDSSVPSSAVMTVRRGTDVLTIPENKDYVYFNGVRHYSTINVFSAGTFFVNEVVLALLR